MDGCFNLKEKRRVLQSLLQKLRHDLGVAVAEVDDNDLWNRAVIGVASVSSHAGVMETALEHVISRIDSDPDVEIVSVNRYIERPG